MALCRVSAWDSVGVGGVRHTVEDVFQIVVDGYEGFNEQGVVHCGLICGGEKGATQLYRAKSAVFIPIRPTGNQQ
jgi:hypothetical protein